MGGFCELAIGLPAPKLATAGAKSPVVTGGYLKYSVFGRRRPETRFDRDCVADAAVRSSVPMHAIWQKADALKVRKFW
jgi:uncharacterized membrane protein